MSYVNGERIDDFAIPKLSEDKKKLNRYQSALELIEEATRKALPDFTIINEIRDLAIKALKDEIK